MISPAGQASIASYKIGGEQLFFPNATAVEACAHGARLGWPIGAAALQRAAQAATIAVYAAGSLRAPITRGRAGLRAARIRARASR